MAPPIPTTILLERERANGFRRHMEILHESCTDTPHFDDLRMSQLLDELAWYKGSRVQYDTPLITVEWAVGWANSVPAPPIGVLRAAREMLQAAADDWAASFQFAHQIRSKAIVLHEQRWPDWFVEVIRVAASEQRRIEIILRENWPGGTQQDEETALAQMRSGTYVGLDEAFTQIACVTSEEWEQRVEAHRKVRRP